MTMSRRSHLRLVPEPEYSPWTDPVFLGQSAYSVGEHGAMVADAGYHDLLVRRHIAHLSLHAFENDGTIDQAQKMDNAVEGMEQYLADKHGVHFDGQ